MDVVRIPLQNAFVFVKFSDKYTLDGIIKSGNLGQLVTWLSTGQLVMKWEPTSLQKVPFVFLSLHRSISPRVARAWLRGGKKHFN